MNNYRNFLLIFFFHTIVFLFPRVACAEPIHDAVKKGNLSEVKKLLEEGVNIESGDKYGYTPLHIAAWRRHVNVVKYLIEKGANINAQATESKETPLLLMLEEVIFEGNDSNRDPIELVKLLVG